MSDILYFWHAHWCSTAAATLLYLRNLQQKTEKKKHQQQQKPKQENKGGKRTSRSEVLITLKLGCFPESYFPTTTGLISRSFFLRKAFFIIISLLILDFQL